MAFLSVGKTTSYLWENDDELEIHAIFVTFAARLWTKVYYTCWLGFWVPGDGVNSVEYRWCLNRCVRKI